MQIKKMRYVILLMLIIGAIALFTNIGSPFDANVLAAEGDSETQYYNGHECVPQQVIIIYDNKTAAKESADMIVNSSAEFEITGSSDPNVEGDVPVDDSGSGQNGEDSQNWNGNSNDVMTQAEVMETQGKMVVVEVDAEIELSEYINYAMNQPGVAFAQPNYIYTITAEVDDPIANINTEYYGWHLHTIDAFSAWDYTFGSSDVVVGVIDTGVDLDHPDLAANIIAHTDTADDDGSANDADGHGTMVSGFIAALTNDTGSCGVAPNCSLVVVDAFYSSTSATSQDLLEAVEYLVSQDVDIINMSFGGPGSADTVLNNAIVDAYNAGIVVVASAGNDNTDEAMYPSDLDCVISVMASTIDDDFLWYDDADSGSNYGDAKDISAPGVLVGSTYIDGGYVAGTGTSFSSPIVAGTAALMLSLDSTLTPDDIASILYSTAADTCTQRSGGGAEYGAGRLDAGAAVAYVYNSLSVSGIEVAPESKAIDHSETLQLTTTITPSNAVNKNVTYTSSDETIATVDTAGLVTPHAVNNGTAVITATSEDGGHADTCTVTVVDVKVDGVDIIEESQIDVGESASIAATVSPSNATNQNVTYTSSDENIATVDASGNVTGIAMGTATITATTEESGFTDTCTLRVGYPVESVSIDDDQVNIGETYQIVPVFTPNNATNKNATYLSSDTDIATVDASGLVTGVALGTATITITTEDGGHTDTADITVVQPVEEVILYPERYYMSDSDTLQLETTVLPDNAANKNVAYSSSDELVATVDSAGLVTAVGIGDAVITVTTEDGSYEDTCSVHVAEEVITSSVYTVDRMNRYYIGVAIGTSVQEIIDSVDHTIGTVHVYNIDMEEVTEGLVSSGYYIQLDISEEVADEVRILIEGDCDPNTVLDIIDYTLIRLHILNVAKMSGISLEVADVNNDGSIDVIDYTLVRLHILGVLPLY